MTLDQLLDSLQQAGIRLHLDDGALRFRAPQGAMSAALRAAIADHKPALIAMLDRERGEEGPQPLPAGDCYPLAWGQQRFWLLQQIDGGAALNLPLQLRLAGSLDGRALEQALAALSRRHPLLATRYLTDKESGGYLQQIVPLQRLPLQRVDVAGEGEESLRRRAIDEISRPFSSSDEPLWRLLWLDAASDGQRLIFTFHHSICDGVSLAILADDLGRLYRSALAGETLDEVAPLLHYHDYAVWSRQRLESGALEGERRYWIRQMTPLPEPIELPCDRPRPARFDGLGGEIVFDLERGLGERLQEAARHYGCSLFTLLVAWVEIWLARHCHQTEVVLGTPVAGRQFSSLEGIVGLFLNTVVIRDRVELDHSFNDQVARVRSTLQGAFAHQEYPFDRLVESLNPERDLSRSPLFDVTIILQNQSQGSLDLGGGDIEVDYWHNGSAKSDLTLSFREWRGGIGVALEYASALFDEKTVWQMAGRLVTLGKALVDRPALPLRQLDLHGQEELEWIAERMVGERQSLPEASVVGAIARLVVECGGADALHYADERLDYRSLWQRAGVVASELRGLGVGPGCVVAIALNRGLSLLPAMVGVMRSGATFLPLDPSLPAARLADMAADAGVGWLLCDADPPFEPGENLRLIRPGQLDWQVKTVDDLPAITASDPAYILYTSGSTGRPKGVVIPHAALLNFLLAMREALPDGDKPVTIAALTTVSFDISLLELLLPLISGGAVDLLSRQQSTDPEQLAAALERSHVTHVQATPASWRMLVDSGWSGRPGLHLLVGGEALPASLATALLQRGGSLTNLYGPTETTIWSCATSITSELAATHDPLPLGRPIANTILRIVAAGESPELPPLPVGSWGELWIGGEGVATGYHQRDQLNRERFHCDDTGLRWYRTGDRVRLRTDGALEFGGRFDHQIKLRGFRIELGEIESRLSAHPAVAQSAVVVRQGGDGGVLAAFLIATPGSRVESEELRNWLSQSLPEYMVPALISQLEEMPLTASGKIDRRALLPLIASVESVCEPAVGEIEIGLAQLWRDNLGLPTLPGRSDNYFALGGHSLLGVQLIARIADRMGYQLTLRDLFEAPQLAALAARVAVASIGQGSGRVYPQRSGSTRLPLSHAQRRLWFVSRLAGAESAYNLPLALRFEGPIDPPRLKCALERVVARHEVLRWAFPEVDGEPEVVEWQGDLPMSVVDLRHLAEREAVLHQAASDDAARHFDLANGPLFSLQLLRVGEEQWALLFNIHHLLVDGWGVDLLLGELVDNYRDGLLEDGRSRSSAVAARPDYGDYCLWQQAWLAGESVQGSGSLAAERNWWLEQLADLPTIASIDSDRGRGQRPEYRGGRLDRQLPSALRARVEQVASDSGASPFMLLLTLYALLLSRYGAGEDLPIGVPVANRHGEVEEGMVGLFANTVIHRIRLQAGESLDSLLGRVRELSLAIQARQGYPFELLVEALAPQRSLAHSPLFQIMFAFQNTPLTLPRLDGVTVSAIGSVQSAARFDLTLNMEAEGDGWLCHWEYDSHLFRPERIGRLADHWQEMLQTLCLSLEGGLGSVSSESLLPASDRDWQQQLDWGGWLAEASITPPLSKVLNDVFEHHADRIAIEDSEENSLSYGELGRLTARVANRLLAMGLQQGDRIALLLPRGAAALICQLAALRAGLVWVPIDPDYPPARRQLVLEDSRPALTIEGDGAAPDQVGLPGLARTALSALLVAAEGCSVEVADQPPDSLPAYIIYTSGSTGVPKGVVVGRRGLANLALAQAEMFGLVPAQRVLQFASPSFDASVSELLSTIVAGATLIPFDPASDLPVEQWIEQRSIDCVTLPPGVASLLDPTQRLPSTLVVAGEALPLALARQWADGHRLINAYGPTEVTVCASMALVDQSLLGDDEERVSIGRPIRNSRLLVLRSSGNGWQRVPAGVAGELMVAGPGVADGYWQRPDLTSERFFDWSVAGEVRRLYRTGDRVRWRDDGQLDYLGRIDQQLKLRGHRIEPSEIESLLCEELTVVSAAVALDSGDGAPRLLAWVVVAKGESFNGDQLRSRLATRLPTYMVPAAIIQLERLPLTTSGKVDRDALPRPQSPIDDRPPADALERVVATLYSSLLGRQLSGVESGFFELGGHSLLATRLVSRLRRMFRVNLPLEQLFTDGSVAAVSAWLRTHPALAGKAERVAARIEQLSAMRQEERDRQREG